MVDTLKRFSKFFVILSLLFINVSIPIHASEDVTPGELINLNYDEFIEAIAREKNITNAEAAEMVYEQNKDCAVPYDYETRYGYFNFYYNVVSDSYSSTFTNNCVRCGVYATYQVDPNNWQLRYFSAVNYAFVQPGNSVYNLNVLNAEGTIINSTTIYYYCNFTYEEGLSTGGTRPKNKSLDYYFYL